ncbi:MAG: DUF484 family protein [Sterolibacterium sp.]|nr:DUF484 family protein [Sterolibacterium sp.]MBP9799254.1 DUF484 family protein [Sterolibacterium sp.]
MKVELDANDVAAYLKAHPDFFNLYADLLAQIVIVDPHNGRAISITERQMGALRDRNKQLEAKLAELISFGEENDTILSKLHAMTLALVAARTFPAVVHALHQHLENAFEIPHVALHLWDIGTLEALPEFSPADEETRQFAHQLKHPYCGASSTLTHLPWLASGIRSLAAIPLRSDETIIGLLTLGSEEAQRFYPEMGTLFLERIGELSATAVLRTLLAEP